MIWIIVSPFKSIYETPKDFSRVSFSIECRTLTVGLFRNELQHMQHVIVIINNKYFTIDKTNYFSLLDFFFVHAFVAVLQHYYLFCKNRYNIVTLQVILHFCLFLHDAERLKRAKTRFCTAQKGQKEKNYASALCRKAKKKKTRFCTMQKGQKEKNYASARCRKVKKRKNTLLHGAERPKREKTCFCTVQKGQKEKKHASARCRKIKKRKNTLLHDAERSKREKTRFCTMQKGQKGKKYASARRRKVKKGKNTFLSDSERLKREKSCF